MPLITHDRFGLAVRTAVLSCLLSVVLMVNFDSVLNLLRLWLGHGNQRYMHGLPLAAFAIGLCVVRYRAHQASILLTTHWPALAGLLAVSLLSGLADAVHLLIAQQLLLPVSVLLVLICMLGINAWRLFAAPIALLFLAIPVWEYLNTPLRLLTTPVVSALLQLSQIPTAVDGFYIAIPNGLFLVDVYCSGLSALIVSLTVAAVYVLLARCSLRSGLRVLSAAALLAFVVNLLRIYIVIVAGYLSDMQHYFIVREHNSLGWVLFALSIAWFLWVLGYRLPLPHSLLQHQRGLPTVALPAQSPVRCSAFALLVLMVYCSAPLLSWRLQAHTASAALQIPQQLGTWQLESSTEPEVAGSRVSVDAVYRRQATALYLRVDYFSRQQQGDEAVNEVRLPYDSTQWRLQMRQLRRFRLGGNPASVEQLWIENDVGEQRMLIYGYYVDGKLTASPLAAKLYNLLGLLRAAPQVSVISAATLLPPDSRADAADLTEAVLTALPALTAAIDSVGGATGRD